MPKALESTTAAGDGETASADQVAFSIKGLSVAFGGVAALSDVTFDFGVHETVAIVGPNGAGKTTFLNALGGLLAGVTGEVRYFGESVLGRPPNQLAHAGISRSFQDPKFIESQTVIENILGGAHTVLGYGLLTQIFLPRAARRLEEKMALKALDLLDLVNLRHIAATLVGQQPYGIRKLIDIIRALMSSPKVLMLDEPTSGLDKSERELVQKLLQRLQGQPLLIIIVEHHMDLVRAVANRVIGLHAGKVLEVGTPSEVLDSEAFLSAILGRSITASETAGQRDSSCLEGNS
jgi:branched-chain amino acid transport system ATP-binding protein